ncbi:uncharacterized protein LOC114932694 [Nylanderia fulva]|uniref:uncharacterized protein LOC114932694 n=1 Tax=Nylanderia fulva TaxID=613905 RepID=UPI0010FB8969|nr:uncharacterized protein LOC114932694 [Nylanderia fulva]
MTHPKRDLKNINFKTINNYSLQINRWCLKVLAAWPITNTLIEKIISFVMIIFWSVALAIVLIPCIFYVLLEDSDFATKIGIFGPLFNRIVGVISYWTLLKRRRDIRNCIRHMETDWQLIRRIEDREIMLQYAKFGRFIAGFSAAFTQGGQLLYSIAKSLRTTTIIVNNQTFITHPMTCPAYSRIIDTRFSPINEIMIVIQFLTSCAVNCAIMSVCSLTGVLAMHACGQLRIMCVWLNKFVEDYKKVKTNSVELKLTTIIEHHLRVLRYFILHVEL